MITYFLRHQTCNSEWCFPECWRVQKMHRYFVSSASTSSSSLFPSLISALKLSLFPFYFLLLPEAYFPLFTLLPSLSLYISFFFYLLTFVIALLLFFFAPIFLLVFLQLFVRSCNHEFTLKCFWSFSCLRCPDKTHLGVTLWCRNHCKV